MILEVKSGSFGYKNQPTILKDINIYLGKGKILSILGPNGIGKTTLLKCIIGLLPWNSGATFVDNKNIKEMSVKDIWSSISYIPQVHKFSFSYTGLEMVIMGTCSSLSIFKQPGKHEIELAKNVMEKIGISYLATKDCNRMSGGELQMVMIAKALVNNPSLIVLDEPETGLDFYNQIMVLNMIESLAHNDGISAIMNTHYPTNAISIADDAFMFSRKEKIFYGKAEQILTKQNITYCFDVHVLINETAYNGKNIKSIMPVEICS